MRSSETSYADGSSYHGAPPSYNGYDYPPPTMHGSMGGPDPRMVSYGGEEYSAHSYRGYNDAVPPYPGGVEPFNPRMSGGSSYHSNNDERSVHSHRSGGGGYRRRTQSGGSNGYSGGDDRSVHSRNSHRSAGPGGYGDRGYYPPPNLPPDMDDGYVGVPPGARMMAPPDNRSFHSGTFNDSYRGATFASGVPTVVSMDETPLTNLPPFLPSNISPAMETFEDDMSIDSRRSNRSGRSNRSSRSNRSGRSNLSKRSTGQSISSSRSGKSSKSKKSKGKSNNHGFEPPLEEFVRDPNPPGSIAWRKISRACTFCVPDRCVPKEGAGPKQAWRYVLFVVVIGAACTSNSWHFFVSNCIFPPDFVRAIVHFFPQ